jgi:hypothetical protein
VAILWGAQRTTPRGLHNSHFLQHSKLFIPLFSGPYFSTWMHKLYSSFIMNSSPSMIWPSRKKRSRTLWEKTCSYYLLYYSQGTWNSSDTVRNNSFHTAILVRITYKNMSSRMSFADFRCYIKWIL